MGDQRRLVTIVLEVNQDADDDVPIKDAVTWALEGEAISTLLGERIVSIKVEDA
jgi:hypothetical protein